MMLIVRGLFPALVKPSWQLLLAQSFDMRLPSSRRAMAMRCTSSGPSARRSVRAPAQSRATGKLLEREATSGICVAQRPRSHD